MASPSAPLYGRDYVLLNGANFLYSLYSVIFIFLPAYMYRLGIGIAFLAALFPLAMREPSARERPSMTSLKVFLSRPFLVPNTAGYLFGVAYGSIFTLLPVYLVVRGSQSLGAFVFVYALSVIGSQMLLFANR